jgi:hypothetical protein
MMLLGWAGLSQYLLRLVMNVDVDVYVCVCVCVCVYVLYVDRVNDQQVEEQRSQYAIHSSRESFFESLNELLLSR